MPLVRISLLEGKPANYRKAISDAIHRALVETMEVTEHDRFHIISEHAKANFIYERQYLDTIRTDALVVIQIALNRGRTTEMKNRFYGRVVELLHHEAGIEKGDVFIGLVEVAEENWFVP